jgi:hypothetical protein
MAVWGNAVQYTDGAIEFAGIDAPAVTAQLGGVAVQIDTTAQARLPARAPVATADEIDGWVARR